MVNGLKANNVEVIMKMDSGKESLKGRDNKIEDYMTHNIKWR